VLFRSEENRAAAREPPPDVNARLAASLSADFLGGVLNVPGDASFQTEGIRGFAGMPVIESRYQYAVAFAGTVDCISNSGLGWGISAMEEFTLDLGI
jgi:hypothetical protein